MTPTPQPQPPFNWQSLVAIASLLAALAAIITSAAGVWQTSVNIHDQAVAAQQHQVEAAVAAPNPGCNPQNGTAKMGICAQNRGALATANAIAPKGSKVPTHRSSSTGQVSAIFESNAYAAGPVDRGEDVSSWQGCNINWASRRGYLSFAHFKDGEGGSYTDQCAYHNATSMKAAGLPHGTYYFDRTNVSPELEADRAAAIDSSIGYKPSAPGSIPHTLDVESNNGGLSPPAACNHIARYIIHYESKTGRKQMFVYTSVGTNPAGNCPLLPAGTMLWDAAYGPSWNNTLGLAAIEWQYSDGTYGPTPRLDGTDSDIWLGTHAQLIALAHAVPPISPPTNAQWTQCGQLRWLRNHGHAHDATTGDLRNSLAANNISCGDHSAQHYKAGPNPPQPSVDQFRQCRTLIAWRKAGRPQSGYAQAAHDRNALVHYNIWCNGRAPLIAVHR